MDIDKITFDFSESCEMRQLFISAEIYKELQKLNVSLDKISGHNETGEIRLDYSKGDKNVTCRKCGNRIWYDSKYSYFPDAIEGYIDYCTKCAPQPPKFK